MEKKIPGWNEYFMRMVDLAKSKSKDRSTQVGAVIVGEGNTVLSMGYNGFPRGIDDNVESRHERPIKYLWVEHSERNAIYAAARNGVKINGATMYVSCCGAPCADCCRAIIQSGIKKVVVMAGEFEGKGSWTESCTVGKEMLLEAGVQIVFLNYEYKEVTNFVVEL